MPRYTFKGKDLAPFRQLLAAPAAKKALSKALPVKRIAGAGAARFDELPQPRSFAIRGRANPDGVPLHEVLAVVKQHVPAVTSLALQRGRLVVGHGGGNAAITEAVRAVLADSKVVAQLTKPPSKPAGPVAKLRRAVLDNSLSDADWLRAFRAYAVATMDKLEPEPSGPIIVTPGGDKA